MLDLAWECDDVAGAQEERKIEASQTGEQDERHAYHTAQPAWCMDLVIQEPEERESTTNEKDGKKKSRPALSQGGAPAHLCDAHREGWLAKTEEQRRQGDEQIVGHEEDEEDDYAHSRAPVIAEEAPNETAAIQQDTRF
jgi:hypothetical protein